MNKIWKTLKIKFKMEKKKLRISKWNNNNKKNQMIFSCKCRHKDKNKLIQKIIDSVSIQSLSFNLTIKVVMRANKMKKILIILKSKKKFKKKIQTKPKQNNTIHQFSFSILSRMKKVKMKNLIKIK